MIFIIMGRKGKSKYNGVFIEGQKFGRYTIFDSSIILEKEAKVKCICECGNINNVSCYSLTKGTSTQCLECGNSMKGDNNPAWLGFGKIPNKIFGKIKHDAELRQIPLEITIEYINELYNNQKEKCVLSGLKLNTSTINTTASLDRIDSSKGYIEGNVQWVHKDINMMKRIYSQEHFIYMCKLVAKHNWDEFDGIIITN